MTPITWAELKNTHIRKINGKNDAEITEFQSQAFRLFCGEEEHPLLKVIAPDLDDFDKRIVYTGINHKLKELVTNHLSAIVDGNHEFLIKSQALVNAVVLPALGMIGKDRETMDRLDKMVVWGCWVCVFLLRGYGWQVFERPTKLQEKLENGESITEFDNGLFQFILVRMDPSS